MGHPPETQAVQRPSHTEPVHRPARSSRRALLAAIASGATVGTAGCIGSISTGGEDDGSDGPETPTPLPADGVSIERDRDVEFRETPERTLTLNLTRPADDVTRPLLVHVHGGGWRRGSKGYPHAERMARAGMAVASVEYRLSGEATYPAAVRDVVAAIKWLRVNAGDHGIDPERVALVGESAGGHLSALVASDPEHPAFQPEGFLPDAPVAVDAVVPISGIYDLTLGYVCVAEITRRFLDGTCDDVPDRAREASPVTHADGDDPPVLLFHAPEDSIIDYEQATTYRDRLADAGVDVELYTAEDGGHMLGEQADAFLPEQEAFLQEHLAIER